MNLLKYFAQGVSDIFGTIKPPVDDPTYTNPTTGLNNLVFLGVRLFITFAALVGLAYLLWGAFDWIASGGEKESIEKARLKITNAIIGLILVVAALGVFSIVTGDILGIVKKDASGNWNFEIPNVNNNRTCIPDGLACDFADQTGCCSNKCVMPIVIGEGTGQARCQP